MIFLFILHHHGRKWINEKNSQSRSVLFVWESHFYVLYIRVRKQPIKRNFINNSTFPNLLDLICWQDNALSFGISWGPYDHFLVSINFVAPTTMSILVPCHIRSKSLLTSLYLNLDFSPRTVHSRISFKLSTKLVFIFNAERSNSDSIFLFGFIMNLTFWGSHYGGVRISNRVSRPMPV